MIDFLEKEERFTHLCMHTCGHERGVALLCLPTCGREMGRAFIPANM